MGRSRILAAQAGTAADDEDIRTDGSKGVPDIQEQRFAQGARFLRAVDDCHFPDRFRDIFKEVLQGERTVQMDSQETHLFAVGIQVIHGFFRSFGEGPHRYDHAVSVRSAIVDERMVFTAGQFGDLLHVSFHDVRNGFVVFVYDLLLLEIYIAVFQGAFNGRMVRIRSSVAEFFDCFLIGHGKEILVVIGFDLLYFMRGAESVKEVQERHAALDGGKVCHSGQVHRLLDAAFSQHGKAGLPAGHDVALVTEDTEGIGAQGAGCHVEDTRQQFAGNLVHIRDHQQQALGSRIRRGERTGLQRTVYSPGRTAFGLHFDDFDSLAEHVFDTLGRPFIDMFSHG